MSAVILVTLALFEQPWRTLPAVTGTTVFAILYAAVLVTLSHIWLYWGIRAVPASVWPR